MVMDREAFERTVIATGKAEGLSENALRFQIAEVVARKPEWPRFYSKDVADAVQGARRVESFFPQGAREEEPVDLLQAPESEVSQLLPPLRDWLQEMRELFPGELPRPSRDDASTWIKSRADGERRHFDHEKAREAFDYLGDAARALESLTGWTVRFQGVGPLALPFPLPDGSVDRVATFIGTRLNRLAREVVEKSGMTGFSVPSLVAWVVADERPRLHALSVGESVRFGKTTDNAAWVRRELVFTVRSPSIARSDLDLVHRHIRALWGVTGTQTKNAKDEILVGMVESMGGEPEGDRVPFWEGIRTRLNEEHPGTFDYRDWRGPWMRWKRLKEKLYRLQEESILRKG